MPTTTLTTQDVASAAQELASMRRSLMRWLKYRAIGDQVLAGTAKVKKPLAYAQRAVASMRDMAAEQDLATKLAALLGALMPGQALPDPNVTTNPNAAVQLAQIAIAGPAPGPVATGSLSTMVSSPWFWPAMIVAGVLFVIVTAIQTSADVAKDHEEKACIEAGACTDYGFWLKAGGVVALAWFAWREMGVGDFVKGHLKKGRS